MRPCSEITWKQPITFQTTLLTTADMGCAFKVKLPIVQWPCLWQDSCLWCSHSNMMFGVPCPSPRTHLPRISANHCTDPWRYWCFAESFQSFPASILTQVQIKRLQVSLWTNTRWRGRRMYMNGWTDGSLTDGLSVKLTLHVPTVEPST